MNFSDKISILCTHLPVVYISFIPTLIVSSWFLWKKGNCKSSKNNTIYIYIYEASTICTSTSCSSFHHWFRYYKLLEPLESHIVIKKYSISYLFIFTLEKNPI